MASLSRITELAATIQALSTKLESFCFSNGLDPPSFELGTAPKLPDEIQDVQAAILEATDELSVLVQGPLPYLMTMIAQNHNYLISLHAIYRFNIATSFPVNEEASFAQIAQKCGLREDDTRRLLRHAMAYRIFREPRKGVVAHSPVSKVLAEIPLVRQLVGQGCEDMLPAAVHVVDAMAQWPNSEEPLHAGFQVGHGTSDTMFDFLSKDDQRSKRYADTMSLFYSLPGLEISHVVENYDWAFASSVAGDGITTIVDIGGSHGTVATAIARRFPSTKCIVQDRPAVVASATTPADLADRLTFMEHDFFTEQPIKGADIYYMRWILHDWPDKYALQILQALIPALGQNSRVVLSEYCIPDHGTMTVLQDRSLRSLDLVMKEAHNSKERDADDWVKLFHDADTRYKVQEIKTPPGSRLSLIAAIWQPSS